MVPCWFHWDSDSDLNFSSLRRLEDFFIYVNFPVNIKGNHGSLSICTPHTLQNDLAPVRPTNLPITLWNSYREARMSKFQFLERTIKVQTHKLSHWVMNKLNQKARLDFQARNHMSFKKILIMGDVQMCWQTDSQPWAQRWANRTARSSRK